MAAFIYLSSSLNLILTIASSAIIYFLFLFLVKALNQEDVQYFRQVISVKIAAAGVE
jgi:hypothetical protein